MFAKKSYSCWHHREIKWKEKDNEEKWVKQELGKKGKRIKAIKNVACIAWCCVVRW